MNIAYMIYEAERPRTMAEQREADVQAGEFAAAVARVGHSLRRTATRKQEPRRGGQRPATTALSCAVPRPR